MRYHNITKDDMLNGDGLRVVLWVSGCSHCCKGCQNPITWDVNGGVLFDDAAKQKRPSLFAGCKDENKNLYSQICREFDTKGVFIFCTKISDCFLPEVDGE